MPVVKSMNTDNLDTIGQIEAELYEFASWSKKNFTEALAQGAEVNCLWLDDTLIGYAVMLVANIKCSFLFNLSIAKPMQGNGYGQYLLNWCQCRAQTAGCLGMMLDVRVSNQVANYMYERAGFKPIQIRKDYYEAKLGREDGILMGKFFSAPGEKRMESEGLS